MFIVLNGIYAFACAKKNLFIFVSSFFLVLLVQPLFQKMLDSNMYGIHFADINFERMKTNILFPFFLFGLLLVSMKNKYQITNIPFLICLIFFSSINIIFSIDIERSLWVSIDAVLSPILFYLLLSTFDRGDYLDESTFIKIFIFIATVFFTLGFVMYFSVGLQDEVSLYQRSGGSVFLSNIGTQIAVIFFPLIIFSKNKIKFNNYIRIMLLICYILLLFIAMSRTAFVIYSVIALLSIFTGKRNNKLGLILSVVLLVSLVVNLLSIYADIDLVDLLMSRIFMDDQSALSSIEGDERFVLYNIVVNNLMENLLTGIGISNFIFINDFAFSNAHNIFLNILIERGIFIWILFIYFIYKLITGLNSCSRLNPKLHFFQLLKYGVLGYFAIGLTGNDLFISSGFVNSWPMYFLILIYVIQEKNCNQPKRVDLVETTSMR